MKKCPRCQKDIEDKDQKCPHCGYKLGYQNKGEKPQVQFVTPRRRANFIQRIIFYSLIAGFLFGPSFYNLYRNSGNFSGQVVDQDVAANEVALYIYTNLESYQSAFPESNVAGKIIAMEKDFSGYLASLNGQPTASNYQITITNTNTAYIMAAYELEIDGARFTVALNYNTANTNSALTITAKEYGFKDLEALAIAFGQAGSFKNLAGYLGQHSEPLFVEATIAFNDLLSQNETGDLVGPYGRGITLHNNDSCIQVYYGDDRISAKEASGFMLDMQFGGNINEGILGKLR